MQKMNTILLSTIVLFCLLCVNRSPIFGTESCLDIKIQPEQDYFYPEEFLKIYIEVKNNSNRVLYSNNYIICGNIRITDTSGNDFPRKTLLYQENIVWNSILPGETYYQYDYIWTYSYKLRPGIYIAKLVLYDNIFKLAPDTNSVKEFFNRPEKDSNMVDNLDCWSIGKSNPVTIQVIEPKGDDKKALRMLWAAESITRYASEDGPLGGRLDKDDPKSWPNLVMKEYHKLIEIADKYPNSIYAPFALERAFSEKCAFEDQSVCIPAAKRLIENYPNSKYAEKVFSRLFQRFKNALGLDDTIKYLQDIKRNYPESLVSKQAENLLKRIESGEM